MAISMRNRWHGALVAVLAIALGSCESSTGPTGEAPLSGRWVPAGSDFSKICGVDTPCDLQLQLFGTTVTGSFGERVFFEKTDHLTELHGTFTPPVVHLEWDVAPFVQKYDGELRDDTLMIGFWTPPNAAFADSIRWVRAR